MAASISAQQAERNQTLDECGRELPFDNAKRLRLGRRDAPAEPVTHPHVGPVHPESLHHIMPYSVRQDD